MSEDGEAPHPHRRPRRRPPKFVVILASRPRLTSGLIVGLLVALALATIPNALRWSTRSVFAWDAGCLWFIFFTVGGMFRQCHERIRARSAAQDEGRDLILALVVVAAVASIGAIVSELSAAKAVHGLEKTLRIALAFATVAVSWFMVQLIFALHYAHEYYEPDPEHGHRAVQRGLAFPQDERPDYWDFLHFAVIIGVAAQTADVAFTSKELRRIGTVHSLVAFSFNTVVLALTINLLAGLF